MTRETAQKHREAFNAFCEGNPMQCRMDGSDQPWIDCPKPRWEDDFTYRIKPREPREFWACWNKDADLDDPENELRLYVNQQTNIPEFRQQIRVREILPDENP